MRKRLNKTHSRLILLGLIAFLAVLNPACARKVETSGAKPEESSEEDKPQAKVQPIESPLATEPALRPLSAQGSSLKSKPATAQSRKTTVTYIARPSRPVMMGGPMIPAPVPLYMQSYPCPTWEDCPEESAEVEEEPVAEEEAIADDNPPLAAAPVTPIAAEPEKDSDGDEVADSADHCPEVKAVHDDDLDGCEDGESVEEVADMDAAALLQDPDADPELADPGTRLATDSLPPTYQFSWVQKISSPKGKEIFTTAMDSLGHVYVYSEPHLIKLDSATGTPLWTKTFAGNDRPEIHKMVVSADNAVLTMVGAALYQVELKFSGSAGSSMTVDGGPAGKGVMMNISSEGEIQKIVFMNSTETSSIDDIQLDHNGNAYLIGSLLGTLDMARDFDQASSPVLGIKGDDGSAHGDIFVTQLSSDYSHGWTQVLGQKGMDKDPQARLDSEGNIWLTYLSPFSTASTKRDHEERENFSRSLAKIGRDRSIAWEKISTFANWNNSEINLVDWQIDRNNHLILLGTSSQMICSELFSGVPCPSVPLVGKRQTFLSKIGPDGGQSWLHLLQGNSDSSWVDGSKLAVDTNDQFYVSGMYFGSIMLVGNGGEVEYPSNIATGNPFIARYDAQGEMQGHFMPAVSATAWPGKLSFDAHNRLHLEIDDGYSEINFMPLSDQLEPMSAPSQLSSTDKVTVISAAILKDDYLITGRFSGTVDFDFGDGVQDLAAPVPATGSYDREYFIQKIKIK
jgi:hypothetical protein